MLATLLRTLRTSAPAPRSFSSLSCRTPRQLLVPSSRGASATLAQTGQASQRAFTSSCRATRSVLHKNGLAAPALRTTLLRPPRLLWTGSGPSARASVGNTLGLGRQAYMWATQNQMVLAVVFGSTLVRRRTERARHMHSALSPARHALCQCG